MRGIHRVTANSKRGRSLTSGGGITYYKSDIPADIRKHNEEIEHKKAEKKQEKRK